MTSKLFDQIKQDLVLILKANKPQEVLVLRGILSSVHNKEIEKGKDAELIDDDVLSVLMLEAKKRKDAIALYEKGGRPEKAEDERRELEIISKYLPEQLSEEEITEIVKEVIKETGAETMQDMGKVMGQIMAKVKGKADGMKVKEIVGRELMQKA
ncbi:MAG: GatB/YqeY domain-containing protein [Candidatus Paceibacterota bacterium]